MNNIVLTFEDNSTYTIDCSGVDVSAFTNWYGSEKKTDSSINLSLIHKEDDIVLELREIIDIINDRAITKVTWARGEKEILSLVGTIFPSWSLTSIGDLSETINFVKE